MAVLQAAAVEAFAKIGIIVFEFLQEMAVLRGVEDLLPSTVDGLQFRDAMDSVRRLKLGKLMLVVACLAATSCSLAGKELVALRLFEAVEIDATESSQAAARSELGCAPCSNFVQTHDRVTFYYNESRPLLLSRSDVLKAEVRESSRPGERRPHLLILYLRPTGIERLSKFARDRDDIRALIGTPKRLVGTTPLMVVHDVFVAGRFETRSQGMQVAEEMGVPTPETYSAGRQDEI